jgi:hypothetical protein
VGRFGLGTPGDNKSYLNTQARAIDTFFDTNGVPINGNSNGGTNPRFIAEFRDVDGEVVLSDPRPSAASPLWTANGATLQGGAPEVTTYRGAFGDTNWAIGWTAISEFCDMQELTAELPTLIVDTDGDGVSDELEATSALTSLGFSAAVNNVTPTNLFSSLYTATTIQDLRGTGMMIGPVTGPTATVTLPLFSNTTLNPNTWTAAGNVTGTVNTTPGKSFFRVDLTGNAPNP